MFPILTITLNLPAQTQKLNFDFWKMLESFKASKTCEVESPSLETKTSKPFLNTDFPCLTFFTGSWNSRSKSRFGFRDLIQCMLRVNTCMCWIFPKLFSIQQSCTRLDLFTLLSRYDFQFFFDFKSVSFPADSSADEKRHVNKRKPSTIHRLNSVMNSHSRFKSKSRQRKKEKSLQCLRKDCYNNNELSLPRDVQIEI